MAKKAPAPKSTELDGKEFFAAVNLIEQEKGIPKSYMLEKITQALVSAYKRDHEGITDNVTVDFNEDACEVRMYVKKDVVETVDNPYTEMSLEEAQAKLPQAQLGDVLRIEVKTRAFGRIAAQTARQVIVQGMREAERGMIYDEFSAKEHEILTGVVTRIDPRNGKTKILWFADKDKTLAYEPKQNEMVITVHRWFANKSCPGKYIYDRLGQIASALKLTDGTARNYISTIYEKLGAASRSDAAQKMQKALGD